MHMLCKTYSQYSHIEQFFLESFLKHQCRSVKMDCGGITHSSFFTSFELASSPKNDVWFCQPKMSCKVVTFKNHAVT